MNITETRMTILDSGTNIKAIASITLNAEFVISGIRVIDGAKGLFVSMPNRKDANGEYRDIAYPITKEAREQLHSAVLREYDRMTYVAPIEPVSEREPITVDEEDLPF